MLCEKALGNLDSDPAACQQSSRHIDELELNWWELDKRALRKKTREGREIRILLPIGQFVKNGDVIFDDGATLVVVRLAECDVLVVYPRNSIEMGLAALEIGNLHAPAEVIGNEIVVLADGPVESALIGLGISFKRTRRRLSPRRCAGMPTLAVRPQMEISYKALD